MADAAEKPNPRKLKTVPFRMSFPFLLEPKEEEENGVVKRSYQLSMLFPPGTDKAPFNAALKAAMVEKHGEDKSKWPKLKRGPSDVLRDFGEYNSERDKPLPGDWTGWLMVRANANEKFPPNVVGPKKNPDTGKFPVIKDAREVYSGRWARATIDAFFYKDKKGGTGVTFGLKGVQLLKHDSNFSGAVSVAEKDFDDASEEWAGDDAEGWGDHNATGGDKDDASDDWN
jgi:hypothetical protein